MAGAQTVGSVKQRQDEVCQREGSSKLLERGGESEGETERRGGREKQSKMGRERESQKWVERNSEGGQKESEVGRQRCREAERELGQRGGQREAEGGAIEREGKRGGFREGVRKDGAE